MNATNNKRGQLTTPFKKKLNDRNNFKLKIATPEVTLTA